MHQANQPPSPDTPSPIASIARRTLANGLQVLVQPMPASTSIGAWLTVRVGARHEPPARSGISHFLEHMVFRGTARWSEDEVRRVINRRGGWFNGITSQEDTVYGVRLAAHDWRLAIEWLAQIVFHPLLPAQAVDKERQIIRQEKAGRESKLVRFLEDSSLGYKLDTALRNVIFPHPSFHQRVIGEDATLDAIDHAALVTHHKRYYRPNQCALVVAGPITSAEVFDLVTTLFGEIAAGPPQPPPPTPPDPTPRSTPVVVRGPTVADRVRIRVAARTVGLFHPDRWALHVLTEVIDERLTRAIRAERGLAYSVAAGNSMYDDAGMWWVRTSVDAQHQDTIVRRIDDELRAAATGDLHDHEVRDAQTAMIGRWALSLEDSLRRASWISQWTSPLAPDAGIPDYHALITTVTKADIARVATTYLMPEQRVVALHRPLITAPSAVLWASRAAGYGAGHWLARRALRTRP